VVDRTCFQENALLLGAGAYSDMLRDVIRSAAEKFNRDIGSV
jgi:hypothetical protein